MEDRSKWTRTRTRVTKDGLEAVKVYDYPNEDYRVPVSCFPRKELMKKMGKIPK